MRLRWRKNYECLMPTVLLGQGKSFGELAVQKEDNKKL